MLLPLGPDKEGGFEYGRGGGVGREMGCLNESEYPFVFSRVLEMIELDEDFEDEEDDHPREQGCERRSALASKEARKEEEESKRRLTTRGLLLRLSFNPGIVNQLPRFPLLFQSLVRILQTSLPVQLLLLTSFMSSLNEGKPNQTRKEVSSHTFLPSLPPDSSFSASLLLSPERIERAEMGLTMYTFLQFRGSFISCFS